MTPSRSGPSRREVTRSSEFIGDRPRTLIRFRDPAWPIKALLLGYPLWWALGVADFSWIILAIPMAARMIGWRVHRSRPLRVPPGFGIWLLFLVCAVAGAAVLGAAAPGTAPSPLSNRVFSYADRTGSYLGITILLLYAGNLTEDELPRRRLAWMLGVVAIYTILGGLAAMIKPSFQFTSPIGLLVPRSLQSNAFIQAVTRPGLAQLQNVLGGAGANGRPKAPFEYTNTWGASLTMLVPWLIVAWWPDSTRRRRLLVGSLVVVAAVPLLYSLNRAAWLGAGIALAFVVARLLAKRPRALIGTLCAATAVAGVILVATPVVSVIGQRLSAGGSASLRARLDSLAVRDGLSSPIIGYGDTRKQTGGGGSIARGPTANCPLCGQQEVGSTGQLWAVLVCDGIVGAILYVGFFVAGIFHFRRDRTPYGHAGVLVLILSLVYLFSYDALSAPLGFTMLSYALLWRNELAHRREYATRPLDVWRARALERPAMSPEPVA